MDENSSFLGWNSSVLPIVGVMAILVTNKKVHWSLLVSINMSLLQQINYNSGMLCNKTSIKNEHSRWHKNNEDKN